MQRESMFKWRRVAKSYRQFIQINEVNEFFDFILKNSYLYIQVQLVFRMKLSVVNTFQFAICALAFTTFSIDMSKPENRMPLTFTLLLTTVTFKLVVNKNLPKISYLTYLASTCLN